MFTFFRSPHNAPQQQAGLAAAHAEIRKLQQKNAFIQKQLAPKPSTTDVPPSPSRHIISSIVFPTPSKRFSSPNNIFPSPPKVANSKRNNSQPSLTATARQFSSSAEPTSLNLSMFLFYTVSLYSNCALTFADYTSTFIEFWIFIIQIETQSAFLFTIANSTHQSIL